MRDDTIEISGPFEVGPIDVEEYVDEDTGEIIPAHTLDMSDMRRFTFETRSCPCGKIHGYSLEFNWRMVLGWPELCGLIIAEGYHQTARSVEECEG